MKNILQKIYNAYCNDIETNEELTQLLSVQQVKLRNKLSAEDCELLNRFFETHAEEINYLCYESFKQGFRANIQLMLEVLSD
ncbi:MAG: hypothetical protein FWG33_05155 [Oscillospiraceae bacterium]|nr:hypothetical protein [Oscillospiraceae bacterium]